MARNNYLTYEVKERTIFGSGRWIASLRIAGRYTLQDLAEEVAARNSCRPAEVEAFIEALGREVGVRLEGGADVSVKGLGTFYPKMITRMVDTPEEATLKNCVRSIVVGFRPDAELLRAVKEAGLREYAKTKLIEEPDENK